MIVVQAGFASEIDVVLREESGREDLRLDVVADAE